jgi:hypothetical protein
VHSWGKWLSWERQRWAADERGRVDTRAAELVLELFRSAAAEIQAITKTLEGGHDAE